MAIWLPHVRLSFGGTIGVPVVEQWSNTVKFAVRADLDDASDPSSIVTDEQLEAAMVLMDPIVRAWFGGGAAKIGIGAELDFLKLNMIGVNGEQMTQNTHRRDLVPIRGSVQTNPHWYETVVLTHRTDKKRGRAHSGRIFPPLVSVAPDGNTPYIGANVAEVMANAWAACLNELSEALSDALPAPPGVAVQVVPVVASPDTGKPGPAEGPLLQRVTGVVCDRVADVMHSRTRQVPRLEGPTATVLGSNPGA